MSTMAVSWVRMLPGVTWDAEPSHFIDVPIEREAITTSGTSARTTVAPGGCDAAIVTAVDAALIVMPGNSAIDASATLGVDVEIGGQAFIRVQPGETYIAGIER